MKRGASEIDPLVTGIADPHSARRDYDISAGTPLVARLDNPWYPPYIPDTSHAHNCLEIGVCLSGNGRVSIEDRAWPYESGAVLVVPKGVFHSQTNQGLPFTHWRYLIVNQEALLNETAPRMRQSVQFVFERIARGMFLTAASTAEEILPTAEKIYALHERRYPLDGMELDALLRYLLGLLARVPKRGEGIFEPVNARGAIEPALAFISENYTQDLRIADMAASCAMSESYFRKTFDRIMGMPPLEYVNRYRIREAVSLLLLTDDTVLTIAGMTGFSSIATFNRNFRRYVGMAPEEWRKNAHA